MKEIYLLTTSIPSQYGGGNKSMFQRTKYLEELGYDKINIITAGSYTNYENFLNQEKKKEKISQKAFIYNIYEMLNPTSFSKVNDDDLRVDYLNGEKFDYSKYVRDNTVYFYKNIKTKSFLGKKRSKVIGEKIFFKHQKTFKKPKIRVMTIYDYKKDIKVEWVFSFEQILKKKIFKKISNDEIIKVQ